MAEHIAADATHHSQDIITQAVPNATVQTLQDQLDRLQAEHDRVSSERDALQSELDAVNDGVAGQLHEKDTEIGMLRQEVSRLLRKNMKETVEYNDLLDEYLEVYEMLERIEGRVREGGDTGDAGVAGSTTPLGVHQDMGKGKGKTTAASPSVTVDHAVEQKRLSYVFQLAPPSPSLTADQQAADAVAAALAERMERYHTLRDDYITLKRKYKDLTHPAIDSPTFTTRTPITTAAITNTAAADATIEATTAATSPLSKKRANQTPLPVQVPSANEELSNFIINLKIYSANPAGAVTLCSHMHSMDVQLLAPYTFERLKTVSWNLFVSSYSGAPIYRGLEKEGFEMAVRGRGFHGGRQWKGLAEEGWWGWWEEVQGAGEEVEIEVVFKERDRG